MNHLWIIKKILSSNTDIFILISSGKWAALLSAIFSMLLLLFYNIMEDYAVQKLENQKTKSKKLLPSQERKYAKKITRVSQKSIRRLKN